MLSLLNTNTADLTVLAANLVKITVQLGGYEITDDLILTAIEEVGLPTSALQEVKKLVSN